MKAKNPIDKHAEKVSIKTLKTVDAMAEIMGQKKEDARKQLKKLGYSDNEIMNIEMIDFNDE